MHKNQVFLRIFLLRKAKTYVQMRVFAHQVNAFDVKRRDKMQSVMFIEQKSRIFKYFLTGESQNIRKNTCFCSPGERF